jgi:glutathione synthase/RimK-type ligase-like ATP-grasp enzyme
MQAGDITEQKRAVVEALRDKLVQDGMFFVGIDVIGDKVVEINAESPGGLQAIERLYDVDICPVVIDALERRTRNGQARPSFDTPPTTAPGSSPQRARQQPTGR